MAKLSKLQSKSLRFLLWSVWLLSVSYSVYLTGSFLGHTLTKLLVGGYGALLLDAAITGGKSVLVNQTLLPVEQDSSLRNRNLRRSALSLGLLAYFLSVFWPVSY